MLTIFNNNAYISAHKNTTKYSGNKLLHKNIFSLCFARYLPTSSKSYETPVDENYLQILEGARACVKENAPKKFDEALAAISGQTPAVLPGRLAAEFNASTAIAVKISQQIDTTVKTLSCLASVDEQSLLTSTTLGSVDKLRLALDKAKNSGTVRIEKSLDKTQSRKIWLFTSGVVLVGAAALTVVYYRKSRQ